MATTTTDANGNYLFAGLYAGDYVVEVDETSVVDSPYDDDSTLADAMEVVSVAGSTTGMPPWSMPMRWQSTGGAMHRQRRLRLQLDRLHRRLRLVG